MRGRCRARDRHVEDGPVGWISKEARNGRGDDWAGSCIALVEEGDLPQRRQGRGEGWGGERRGGGRAGRALGNRAAAGRHAYGEWMGKGASGRPEEEAPQEVEGH